MTQQWHGGKGSAPRKKANQKAYEDNWEKIFGRTDKNLTYESDNPLERPCNPKPDDKKK